MSEPKVKKSIVQLLPDVGEYIDNALSNLEATEEKLSEKETENFGGIVEDLRTHLERAMEKVNELTPSDE